MLDDYYSTNSIKKATLYIDKAAFFMSIRLGRVFILKMVIKIAVKQ